MFTGVLYKFQREAVRKMLDRRRLMVAMVMGSGKTPTTLAACEDLLECGDVTTGIVLCPASLKYQWAAQIENFTTSSYLVIDGTPKERKQQYAAASSGEIPYVIMNYEQVRNDWDTVKNLPRGFIVGDEITAIKSFTAKRSKKVKRFHAPYIFGLTGKPIENRAEELFSIMQWIDPTVLGRWEMFDRAFIVRNPWGGVVRYRNIPTLRDVMEPAWIRLSRDDIADQLPDVVSSVIPVRLDKPSRDLYNTIREDLLNAIGEATQIMGTFDLFAYYHGEDHPAVSKARGKVMARFQALRSVTAAPELLQISADIFEKSEGKNGSEYAMQLRDNGNLNVKSHPKLDALMERIDTVVESGEKVVVFSQYVQFIKLLSKKLKHKHVVFHGGMNAKDKEVARMQFRNDPDTVVFVSSDSGGYGVDLPQASVLINYDLPWSAGAADQRNARIDRMSTEHEKIYIEDVIVTGSVEQWIADKVNNKREVGDAIMDGKGVDADGRVNASTESLTAFIDSNAV